MLFQVVALEKLIPLTRAWEIIDGLREKYYFRRSAERVRVDLELVGRELACDVAAPRDSPPHDVASYDGYAMRSRDCRRYPLEIKGSIYAGESYESLPELKEGEAYYIATGAFLPRGADCVLRQEDARVEGKLLYGVDIQPQTKVVPRGSNYKKGEVILKKGTRIRAQELGILIDAGVEEVDVFRKPRVGVLATGNELLRGLIRDTNSFVTLALLREWGCEASYLGIAGDGYSEIKMRIESALEEYDFLVTSGGVSVGKKDYVLRALEELGNIIFYKVKTRPGKPIAVAEVNGKLVFALPGKPSGAFVACWLHIRRFFLGRSYEPYVTAKISQDIYLSTKDTDSPDIANIVFVNLRNGTAEPIGFEGTIMPVTKPGEKYNISTIASNLRSTLVDGFAIVDRDTTKGTTVKIHLMR